MQCGFSFACGLQPGAGGCKPQASSHQVPNKNKNKFLKNGFVRSPAYSNLKTPKKAGGKVYHAQCFKTKTSGAGVVRARPPLVLSERTANFAFGKRFFVV
jgi:hypothetical protein